MLFLFLQHTSAGLSVNENCDPDVRTDLDRVLDHIVPESFEWDHVDEGPDDSVSHAKSTIVGVSLQLPISDGRLALGTWQGAFPVVSFLLLFAWLTRGHDPHHRHLPHRVPPLAPLAQGRRDHHLSDSARVLPCLCFSLYMLPHRPVYTQRSLSPASCASESKRPRQGPRAPLSRPSVSPTTGPAASLPYHAVERRFRTSLPLSSARSDKAGAQTNSSKSNKKKDEKQDGPGKGGGHAHGSRVTTR